MHGGFARRLTDGGAMSDRRSWEGGDDSDGRDDRGGGFDADAGGEEEKGAGPGEGGAQPPERDSGLTLRVQRCTCT